MQPDQKLTDLWRDSRRFTLSAEILPRDDAHSTTEQLEQCKLLRAAGCDFLSIADGPAGTPVGGTDILSEKIRSKLRTKIVPHLICRDRTSAELSNLIELYRNIGASNILALRGDPPKDDPAWKPGRNGSYADSKDLVTKIRHEAPEIEVVIGCYPDAKDLEKQLRDFKQKADAGAAAAITQFVFSSDSYSRFLEGAMRIGCPIPVLPGIIIPHSREHASKVAERFGVSTDEALMRSLPMTREKENEEDHRATVKTVIELVENLKRAGAPGAHFYVLHETALAADVISTIRGAF